MISLAFLTVMPYKVREVVLPVAQNSFHLAGLPFLKRTISSFHPAFARSIKILNKRISIRNEVLWPFWTLEFRKAGAFDSLKRILGD